MESEFGLLPVASSFLSEDESRAVVSEYAGLLGRVGGSEVGPESIGVPARLVFFVVTGGTERRILELVKTRGLAEPRPASKAGAAASSGEPVLLVAYPGRNSLPAALEVLARLQQDGMAGRIVFLDGPDDAAGARRLRMAVDGSAPARHVAFSEDRESGADVPPHTQRPAGRPLAGRRVGLVGPPSDWLVASSPSPALVRDVWGAEVVEIGMGELRKRVDSGTRVSAEFFAQAYGSWASSVCEPTDADLVASGAIYVALRSLVDEFELDAISLRCFDLVVDRGATGCLALSRLADQGIVAGCEGDLPSALAMLWVRERTGRTSWMANPARVDVGANTLTLAHCTVPCSMVDGYTLRSHFESGLGAAVQGSIPTGP
ncbi:MAG: hypothetical protein ABIG03_02290, partial [Candidatus Eisenbacteria bacterium]